MPMRIRTFRIFLNTHYQYIPWLLSPIMGKVASQKKKNGTLEVPTGIVLLTIFRHSCNLVIVTRESWIPRFNIKKKLLTWRTQRCSLNKSRMNHKQNAYNHNAVILCSVMSLTNLMPTGNAAICLLFTRGELYF